MSNLTDIQAFAYRAGEQMTWGYPPGASLVDTVPEDMRATIHPHWNKFPPVNPMWHYILVIQFLKFYHLNLLEIEYYYSDC